MSWECDTGGVADVDGEHVWSPLYLYTSSRFAAIRFTGEQQRDEPPEAAGPLHEVRIIDNDFNTYQEVMEITMMALGMDEETAFAVAWEVDHYGSCVVALASQGEAEAIANVIRLIGIEVQVNPLHAAGSS